MESKHLQYEYVQLMQQAEQAHSRQEALDCIHKATALKAAIDVLDSGPPPDRYSRWCGGRHGFDDFAERLH